ncbi:hypothetical protein [Nocardioides sp.]|uniref:hypothetical protein n=1 Tax=Nocardioides sp. TaxID=35761 RepID=UPI002C22C25F|nr:hypothetical protein [Nocardioides sp.]HXH78832.1 hypothetical protein [Nocardioides sp.]
MAPRQDDVREIRALPFRQAYRVATRGAPAAWNSTTHGLAAMVTMWMIHLWLLASHDVGPSVVGVVLLPAGFVLTTWSWVYSRVLLMFLGIAIGFVGAVGPFWIWNAT